MNHFEMNVEEKELLERTIHELVVAWGNLVGSSPMVAVMMAAGALAVHAGKTLMFEQPTVTPAVRDYLESLPQGLDEPVLERPTLLH